MAGTLSPYPRLQFFDNNGLPLDGGRLYTYSAGTDVQRAIYTDAALATAHTNPALLDGAGRITVYLKPGEAYKFLLKDSNDVFVWEVDPVSVAAGSLSETGGTGGGSTLNVIGTAGVDLPAAMPVYFDLDGRWYLARGDSPEKSTNARLVGMTVSAIARAAQGTICLWGMVDKRPGLVAGVAYYIAATGDITTASAGARLIGYGDFDGHSLIVVQPTFQTAPAQPTPPPVGTAFQAQCLLVAGGGGGGIPGTTGAKGACGGGAGGLFDVVVSLTPGTTYTGAVGAGGAAGANGGDSSVTGTSVSLLVHGGGRGGNFFTGTPGTGEGAAGGSGGGSLVTGALGTPGEGFNGGGGNGTETAGGGGRGGPGAKTFGTTEGRSGGPGYPSSISGGAVTYACGGGNAYPFAFIENGNGGGGGIGGGGNGAHRIDNVAATPGSSPGSGGGGGDCRDDNTLMAGAAGANGICIVRYAGAARCTGGTITSSAGYTIHTFGVGAISLVVT